VCCDQGELNITEPIEFAHSLAQELTSVPGGAAKVYVVKGGFGFLSGTPAFSSLVNGVFSRFLSTLDETSPVTLSLQRWESTRSRFARALALHAQLIEQPAVASRDPLSPLSFSGVDLELEHQQLDAIYAFTRDQQHALVPAFVIHTRPDGMALRKYALPLHLLDSQMLTITSSSRHRCREEPPPEGDEAETPIVHDSSLGSSSNPASNSSSLRGRVVSVRAGAAPASVPVTTSYHSVEAEPSHMNSPERPPNMLEPTDTTTVKAKHGPRGARLVSATSLAFARARRVAAPLLFGGGEGDASSLAPPIFPLPAAELATGAPISSQPVMSLTSSTPSSHGGKRTAAKGIGKVGPNIKL
jgi:hypothetical protein